jgi:hypothetical protein
MVGQPIGYDLYCMKMITLLGLAGIAFVSLSQPTWAGPRGGGGGFAGGHAGRVGGFAGGGSRAAPASYGGGFRGAPAFRSNGAYFTGRSIGAVSRAPRFYYGGARMSAVRPQGFARSVGPSTRSYVDRSAAATRQPNRIRSIAPRSRATDPRTSTATNRQPNRVGPVAGRNRVSNPRTSTAAKRQTAANRQSFVRNHSSERHDANWHRDWDRHHSHFHNHKVFVFLNGFWWGLDPSFYPDYAYDYYPADDYGSNPYDYSYGNPYDYYNYSPYNNDDQSPYAAVRSVRSQCNRERRSIGAFEAWLL